MSTKGKLKVCLISSTGGHLAQLKQLLPVVADYDYFMVTEKNPAMSGGGEGRTYFLTQQERKNVNFIFSFLYNLIYSLFIFLRERPDVIITTGAGAVLPYCFIAKLFGRKLIFIESFAKVSTPTLTGRIIYRISDKFYVQWEELLKVYPKAEYRGKIY